MESQPTDNELLDSLIAQFGVSVRGLRDPMAATGRNESVAAMFADWLDHCGFDCVVATAQPDMFGYGPRLAKDDKQDHAVVEVQLHDRRVRIDWCAAQFGCTELPLVQQIS